ncbi:DNA methyltransferase, partial [Oenococcus oeni]|uniref:DNA methyltransferase n=1 Tax=Oenococcus oeni TaxID=1247 RepID=UPI00117F3196
SNRMKDGHKPGWVYNSKTIDWKPNCNCNATVEECIVLDPFMGAGTTALVSRKLNRSFIGFELNPKYIKIAESRLDKELGMFK